MLLYQERGFSLAKRTISASRSAAMCGLPDSSSLGKSPYMTYQLTVPPEYRLGGKQSRLWLSRTREFVVP